MTHCLIGLKVRPPLCQHYLWAFSQSVYKPHTINQVSNSANRPFLHNIPHLPLSIGRSPKWRKSECVPFSNRPLTLTIWSCREACSQSMGALVWPVNAARTASQLTGEQGGVCAFSKVRVHEVFLLRRYSAAATRNFI